MADEPDKKSGGLRDLVTAESMVQLALSIPAGCLVGWAFGTWLDRHFHQDWISVAGIVLGAIAGFIQIYRTASRFLKDDRGDKDAR
jgi:ATP synthase protein I